MASAFTEWFEAQFGERSNSDATDKELEAAIIRGCVARQELTARHEYDKRHNAALKAWCARDKEVQRG